MHRRMAIPCALTRKTPKAAPEAPLGLLARQWNADADVDVVAAIVNPTRAATRKRAIVDLHDLSGTVELVAGGKPSRKRLAAQSLCVVPQFGTWSTPRVTAVLAGVVHDRQGTTGHQHNRRENT
jgi:hypothetical protein